MRDFLRFCVVASFVVAFFAGKFDLSRIFPGFGHVLEPRIFFIAATYMSVLLLTRYDRVRSSLDMRGWLVLASVLALYAALAINLIVRGNPASFSHYGLDLAVVVAQVIILPFVIRSRTDLFSLVYVVEAISLFLSSREYLALSRRDSSAGRLWDPRSPSIASSFSACAALFSRLAGRHGWR